MTRRRRRMLRKKNLPRTDPDPTCTNPQPTCTDPQPTCTNPEPTCTTRRRRWRSRSSSWHWDRCSPATSACRTRSAAATRSARGSHRPSPPVRPRRSPTRPSVRWASLGPARRVRAAGDCRQSGGEFPRRLPVAPEQVLRGRGLRRDHRAANPHRVAGRVVARHRRERDRRRRQRHGIDRRRQLVAASPAAERIGARLRRLALDRRGADIGVLPLAMNLPLLSISWMLPVAGALLLLLVGNAEGQRNALVRWVTLIVSIAVFAVTLATWASFNPASAEFQLVERHPWIPAFGIDYYLGIDGISLLLVVLTGFL